MARRVRLLFFFFPFATFEAQDNTHCRVCGAAYAANERMNAGGKPLLFFFFFFFVESVIVPLISMSYMYKVPIP